MEGSDADKADAQEGKDQEEEMVLDEIFLGASTSRDNGKKYQALGYESPSKSRELQVKNYPVYQPSPTVSEPNFAAEKAMPNEESAAAGRAGKKHRSKWLWLALLCVILIAVIVPVAVVVSKNNHANASTSNQNADSGQDVLQGGTDGAEGGSDNNGGDGTDNGDGTGEPVISPTSAPVEDTPLMTVIQSVTPVEVLGDETTAQAKAAQWLLEHEDSFDYQGSDERRLQRYAMSVIGFTMFPTGVDVPLFGDALASECEWRGVTCGVVVSNSSLTSDNYWAMYMPYATSNDSSDVITRLVWAEEDLTGTIPTEIALLSALEYLDFGDNALTGFLPEELFTLTELQHLYLHGNQLQGTLSQSFAQLERLVSFYGGSNQFSGLIPQGLGSPSIGSASVRPLRKYSSWDRGVRRRIAIQHSQYSSNLLLTENRLLEPAQQSSHRHSDQHESARSLLLGFQFQQYHRRLSIGLGRRQQWSDASSSLVFGAQFHEW